ncbi:MAG: hypothetical protein R3322_13760 [Kiloniellales bacterium]|nr:hypothetical protein [Kiloniellales bacterium]
MRTGREDWAWVDDEILRAEKAGLGDNGALGRFVRLNVDRDPAIVFALPALLARI